jgi:ABC-type multidrug transport system fused ATPase/permease subunit
MSDKLLRALMQLFAIVANTDEVGIKGREIVERFLQRQISSSLLHVYLEAYDDFLDKLKGKSEEGKTRKRTSVNSVKVLRICTEINKELEQQQKIIVLIRLFEFLNTAAEETTEQHTEFLNTVADTFSISQHDRDNCAALIKGTTRPETDNFLIAEKQVGNDGTHRIMRDSLNGRIIFLLFNDPQLFVCSYFGNDQLFLDGRAIIPGAAHVFDQGSVIRGSKLLPIYYNDVIHSFAGHNVSRKISFGVDRLGYSFKKGKVALHELSFATESGNLVGIMGNSGAGKTTLLNILNGSTKPTKGSILINGSELYADKTKLHGLIGNIPQDDLLIEELTVFQNLFFSSKLYFGKLTDEQLTEKVHVCLRSLMLYGYCL